MAPRHHLPNWPRRNRLLLGSLSTRRDPRRGLSGCSPSFRTSASALGPSAVRSCRLASATARRISRHRATRAARWVMAQPSFCSWPVPLRRVCRSRGHYRVADPRRTGKSRVMRIGNINVCYSFIAAGLRLAWSQLSRSTMAVAYTGRRGSHLSPQVLGTRNRPSTGHKAVSAEPRPQGRHRANF